MSKLYLAYGSNLNKRQMRMRCTTARPLGKLMLKNARLVFRGVADVEYSPNPEDKVPCGLWAINRGDERALDYYEGVDNGMYYKEERITIKYLGRPRNVLMYLMTTDGVFPPSQGYVDAIRKGYKDFGLDEEALDQAIARSYVNKEPDNQTMTRRARQKRDPHPRNRRLVTMPESVVQRRLEERARREAIERAEEEAAEAAEANRDQPDDSDLLRAADLFEGPDACNRIKVA